MKRAVLVCALVLVAIMPAFAAENPQNPWIGTWKLDPARSHFTHQTFTFTKLPNGLMSFDNGTLGSYDFAVDGKPYKSAWEQTHVWTTAGPNAWDVVVTGPDGKEMGKAHHVLSGDGKTLTSTVTWINPDGSPFNTKRVATRVTGTTGLEGKWRDTKVSIPGDTPDTLIVSSPSPGILRWDFPNGDGFVEGKPDGTDHPLVGPIFAPGSTLSFKYLSPNRISYAAKVKEKPDGSGIQTLAADGKSFTDVSWMPGKENEKVSAFYVRQ